MASYTSTLQYIPQGRINAQYWNCTGSHCVHYPVHIAAYGRSSSLGPQGNLRQHFIATFAYLNLVTHCEYVDDDVWCPYVYELMKGITEWWQFWLAKQDLGGGDYRYIDPDDCTNEGCGGEAQLNGIIPLAFASRAFSWMISTSIALNRDPDLRNIWTDFSTHLSSLPTIIPPQSNQTIFAYAESNGTRSLPHPNDNPESVFPMWPAGLVSIHSPGNLTAIGLNTIAYYTGGWTEGNALPIFHPSAVRVGYPASLVMNGWLQRLRPCLQPNLYCREGGGGIETAGATMAVNEMLMQSNEWAVNLFPVWPANHSASFVYMRARGRLLVSAQYNSTEGEISNVEIVSEKDDAIIRIIHPWQLTQNEKEWNARQKLSGGEINRIKVLLIDDIAVYRDQDGDLYPVPIKRHNSPPTEEYGRFYNSNADVVWFEWVGCQGCQYKVRKTGEQKLNQIRE